MNGGMERKKSSLDDPSRHGPHQPASEAPAISQNAFSNGKLKEAGMEPDAAASTALRNHTDTTTRRTPHTQNPNLPIDNPLLTPGIELLAPIANFKGSFVPSSTTTSTPSPPRRKPSWSEHFTTGWSDRQIYRGAIIEAVATMLLVYISGLIDVTIVNMDTRYLPVFAAVSNIFLLTLFIMAAGPGSGGHMNPTITFATMCVGLTGVARGVVYLAGQLLGAAVAGGALRGVLGASRAIAQHGGGCFISGDAVDSGQALLNESLSSLALLFIAFGVGLDPRQAKLFGAIIGPLAVGSGLALVVFGNAGIVPGYTGASMNPARCFAFAVARGGFGDQWIWWVGPVIGSVVHAGVYLVCPPYDERPVRAVDSFV